MTDHSFYELDSSTIIHRGAIYQYRPIFCLEPPLWILRNEQWTLPRSASIYPQNELRDAFRRNIEDNQENVIARAKIRFVVVMSNDYECAKRQFGEVVVVPAYTLDPVTHSTEFLDKTRNNRVPSMFYLPSDPSFPQVAESYLDFRKVQTLDKGFLQEGKLGLSLTRWVTTAAIEQYRRYLTLEPKLS